MPKITLASAASIEELEKLINQYFYSSSYKIEGNEVYREVITVNGANVHTDKLILNGYWIENKKDRYLFRMEM